MSEEKAVWVACRVEQRDGTKGCGSNRAQVVAFPAGNLPGADMGADPQQRQGVQKTFEGLLQGRIIRYKCLDCGGAFTLRQ